MKENKKIVFFSNTFDWIIFRDAENDNITSCITYMDTEAAIKRKDNIIYTTSLQHLNLNIDDYDIYIAYKGKLIHIYEGMKLKHRSTLNKHHNLIDMIKSNYFDYI
jgi:hypothetical protein